MKIRRKLFNYSEGSDKTNVPYFVDGVTKSGRRYKVLVTQEGRGKRQYLDPYRRRSSEELYEEYYSEKNDNYPEDWSEEDKVWEEKLKKGIKKDKRGVVEMGALDGMSKASLAAIPLSLSSYIIPKKYKKLKKAIPKVATAGIIAGGILGGVKGYKERNKRNLHNKGRLERYKKMDKDHREWVRKYDNDPSKFIDIDYYRRGGYKPYKKSKNV